MDSHNILVFLSPRAARQATQGQGHSPPQLEGGTALADTHHLVCPSCSKHPKLGSNLRAPVKKMRCCGEGRAELHFLPALVAAQQLFPVYLLSYFLGYTSSCSLLNPCLLQQGPRCAAHLALPRHDAAGQGEGCWGPEWSWALKRAQNTDILMCRALQKVPRRAGHRARLLRTHLHTHADEGFSSWPEANWPAGPAKAIWLPPGLLCYAGPDAL